MLAESDRAVKVEGIGGRTRDLGCWCRAGVLAARVPVLRDVAAGAAERPGARGVGEHLEKPAAAAAVRAITGGDETVPTVVVGTTAIVNPSACQVIAAVPASSPGEGRPPMSWFARGARFHRRRSLR